MPRVQKGESLQAYIKRATPIIMKEKSISKAGAKVKAYYIWKKEVRKK